MDVSELVAHDSGASNHGVDVRVGVAVDPDVDATISDEVAKLGGEGSVEEGSFVLGGHNGLSG